MSRSPALGVIALLVTAFSLACTSGSDDRVTPPGGTANRIVFETEGHVVTSLRAGRRPEVENVEGRG